MERNGSSGNDQYEPPIRFSTMLLLNECNVNAYFSGFFLPCTSQGLTVNAKLRCINNVEGADLQTVKRRLLLPRMLSEQAAGSGILFLECTYSPMSWVSTVNSNSMTYLVLSVNNVVGQCQQGCRPIAKGLQGFLGLSHQSLSFFPSSI